MFVTVRTLSVIVRAMFGAVHTMFVVIRMCFLTVPTNRDVKTHIVPNCVFHEHATTFGTCLSFLPSFLGSISVAVYVTETSTDVTRYREGPGTGQLIIRDGDIEN